MKKTKKKCLSTQVHLNSYSLVNLYSSKLVIYRSHQEVSPRPTSQYPTGKLDHGIIAQHILRAITLRPQPGFVSINGPICFGFDFENPSTSFPSGRGTKGLAL